MFDTIPPEGIVLGGQDPQDIRDFAITLLNSYVPSDTGDATFAEVTKDYGGSGTTCGYLVHWLMWRLGCRENFVNRNEPQDGLHYVNSQNISKVFNCPYFKRFVAGTTPEPGDIVFLSNGPPGTEHVNVSKSVDGDTWTGYDAGQTNDQGKQCAKIVDRKFYGKSLTHLGTSKGVIGWIPITSLALTAAATLDVPSSG